MSCEINTPKAGEDGILLPRKVCNMEVNNKIGTFVIKESVQLTVPLDRQEKIQVGNRGVALSRVFYLKLSGLHLTKIIRKIWIID